MTYFYSIDKNKLSVLSGNTNYYDLFSTTIIDTNIFSVSAGTYIVQFEDEGKIENICYNIYQNYNYVEELLVFNDILDPYDIHVSDIIYYLPDSGSYSTMYKTDVNINQNVLNTLLQNNNNKSTIKPNIPTINNSGIKQINVNYANNQIQIINKFQ